MAGGAVEFFMKMNMSEAFYFVYFTVINMYFLILECRFQCNILQTNLYFKYGTVIEITVISFRYLHNSQVFFFNSNKSSELVVTRRRVFTVHVYWTKSQI